jgi:hypothetical protein
MTETTEAEELETVVPQRPRRRKRRCEHGRVPERCRECAEEEEDAQWQAR